jgi:hypothetical protein
MHSLKQSILKVVAYFDVFDYPVSIEEIKFFLDTPFNETEFDFAILQLRNYNVLYRFNNLYSLRNEYALVERRIKGNILAEKKLRQAERISRFLLWFPYIKGIAVSGSLSKHFAYEGSDIDFFIITAANRLWVARMFFLSFFKIAKLVGLGNYFCLNYFIDEDALEIPEQNMYTAIEIATLLPKQGQGIFKEFFAKNEWSCAYLPNYGPPYGLAAEKSGPYVKRLVQWLLDNKAGNWLDGMLMHFFKRRWERMMGKKKFAKNGFLLGSYIAEKHVCKPIPHYFQEKILKRFEQRMQGVNEMCYQEQQLAV